MRICVITSSFPLNPRDARASAGFFVRDFAAALAEAGHRVTVVTPDMTHTTKEEVRGVFVRWFPWLGGGKALAYMKPYRPNDALAMLSLLRQGRKELDRLAASEEPDHVLAMWAVPAGLLARGMKERYHTPYTTWCLGSDIWTYGKYPLLKRIVKSVLRDSDLIFADGIKLANDASRLAGRPCPFLPTSRRLDHSLIRPVDVKASGIRFLFVGRYARVKGVDILLDAMARFIQSGHQAHLYMFGGGPWDKRVRVRAGRADLREHVSVGGYADAGTVVSYLKACDCLLIPSRMESIPVVLSDAVQMGVPLIVTDVGDMGCLLREHPAGRVVPPDDSDALCQAMLEMATADRSQYAEHVRVLASRLDISATAKQWLGRLDYTHQHEEAHAWRS